MATDALMAMGLLALAIQIWHRSLRPEPTRNDAPTVRRIGWSRRRDQKRMLRQTTGRIVPFALAWIPIGATVAAALGALYGDITSFTVAGAAIGVVLSALTLIFDIALTKGELSWSQFATGLMLVGALGFALGAVFMPDHLFFYGVLAISLCLPGAIWLGFSLRTSKPHIS
jgi:hypothetical protein